MKKSAGSLLLLLFLSFLAGANVSTTALREHIAAGDRTATDTGDRAGAGGCAARATGSISSAVAHPAQPSLPAHLAAGAFTMPTALLETGATDSWRTPTRTARSHSDALHPGRRTAEARTHISLLQRSTLEFEGVLARARMNEPATFGNPPPASQT